MILYLTCDRTFWILLGSVYQYQYQSVLECTHAVIALGYIQPNEALSEKNIIMSNKLNTVKSAESCSPHRINQLGNPMVLTS